MVDGESVLVVEGNSRVEVKVVGSALLVEFLPLLDEFGLGLAKINSVTNSSFRNVILIYKNVKETYLIPPILEKYSR